MSNKPPRSLPSIYYHIFDRLLRVARSHHYTLMLHGSMNRDGDILALAWTEEASTRETLVNAFLDELDLWSYYTRYEPDREKAWDYFLKPQDRPFGRRSYTLLLPNPKKSPEDPTIFIDLGVIGPDAT